MLSMMPAIAARANVLFTGDGGGEAFLGPLSAFDRKVVRYSKWAGWLASPARTVSQGLYPWFGCRRPLFRKADYALELVSARSEGRRWLATRPITRSETAMLTTGRRPRFRKEAVSTALEALGVVSRDPIEDSLFTVCAPFAWNTNAVYAKTQRIAEHH